MHRKSEGKALVWWDTTVPGSRSLSDSHFSFMSVADLEKPLSAGMTGRQEMPG